MQTDKIKAQIKVKLSQVPIKWVYVALALGIGAAYYFVPPLLSQQDKLSQSWMSNVTLNVLLLYFAAGFLGDRIGKKNKKLGYLVMVGGILVISLFLIFTKE